MQSTSMQRTSGAQRRVHRCGLHRRAGQPLDPVRRGDAVHIDAEDERRARRRDPGVARRARVEPHGRAHHADLRPARRDQVRGPVVRAVREHDLEAPRRALRRERVEARRDVPAAAPARDHDRRIEVVHRRGGGAS
jgi:hypothetical protein